jgi:hypothetical protein
MGLLEEIPKRWELAKNWDARLTFAFGVILSLPLVSTLVGQVFGISPKSYLQCVTGLQSEAKVRDTIAEHTRLFNERAVNFENFSSKSQDKLAKVLLDDLPGNEQESAIRLSSNNQDAIRALLELSKTYSAAIAENAISAENQELLSKMYEAVLGVLKADGNSNSESLKDSYNESYTELNDILDRSEKLPKTLRDAFHIEVYRYLSFVTAKLASLEKEERAKKYYARQSLGFTNDAWGIKNSMKEARADSESQYRQKYFWIDFSRFVYYFKSKDRAKTEEAFSSMNHGLKTKGAEHLRLKLRQHQQLIDPKDYARWESYQQRVGE